MIKLKNLSKAAFFAACIMQMPQAKASEEMNLADLMGGGGGIAAITATLDEGTTKDEKLFWAVGSLRRSLINNGNLEAHQFVNMVAIGVFTGVYDLAPLGSRFYSTDGKETLLQDALALASGYRELYQRPVLTKEYESFSEKWGRTATNVFFDKNAPQGLKDEAEKLINAQYAFTKEAKDATEKILQWFKTTPKFDFVPFDLGAKSMTLMRIYTSPQPLANDMDGLSNLRELIEKSTDPMFAQFRPFLMEGENGPKRKLESKIYMEQKSKRIKFTPAEETSDKDFKELLDVTQFLENVWMGVLGEISLEAERQDDVRGSRIHN